MSGAVSKTSRPDDSAPTEGVVRAGSPSQGKRASAGTTPKMLDPFFVLAGKFPGVARLLRPAACAIIPMLVPRVRQAISTNARGIFGTVLDRLEERRFAGSVIGSFFDFVLDVSRASRMGPKELASLVGEVQGLEAYRAMRRSKRGAILVTAHLGTFEAGLAALAQEERRIHVVFKRDTSSGFERLRQQLHAVLGVVEVPIDDGITSWLALREALDKDEVVVMQGDRAVQGQRSQRVAFLHGHVRLPTGPARLALMTGAPLVPVFAVATGQGTYRVLLLEAIEVDGAGKEGASAGEDQEAALTGMMRSLADAMARVVAAHPHQWLALESVFDEDTSDA
jgi:lauroyl/myristoyl acyltransferase